MFGNEKYNYKPDIKGLLDLFKWARSDFNKKKDKINYIKNNSKNYKILRCKDIKSLMEKK